MQGEVCKECKMQGSKMQGLSETEQAHLHRRTRKNYQNESLILKEVRADVNTSV